VGLFDHGLTWRDTNMEKKGLVVGVKFLKKMAHILLHQLNLLALDQVRKMNRLVCVST
jgi:hypothetical protein